MNIDEFHKDVLLMHSGHKPVLPGAYFNLISEELMHKNHLTPLPWELTPLGEKAVELILLEKKEQEEK